MLNPFRIPHHDNQYSAPIYDLQIHAKNHFELGSLNDFSEE